MALLIMLMAPAVVSAEPELRSETFAYTGSPKSWTVPLTVTQVVVEAWGAGGAANGHGLPGGLGGYLRAVVGVTPGETLQLRVGGAGSGQYGGWNGGGSGAAFTTGYTSGGGGGGTDVRRGGSGLTDRILVAGGGGGRGGGGSVGTPADTSSGAGGGGGGGYFGGGAGGMGGYDGSGQLANAAGGGGGSQSAGGAGGRNVDYGAGDDGELGLGGSNLLYGSSVLQYGLPTAGGEGGDGGGIIAESGGDGQWNGGTVRTGAGGGGGSSFLDQEPSTGATNVLLESLAGVHTGHGAMIISWLETGQLVPDVTEPCSSSATRVDRLSGDAVGYEYEVDIHDTPTDVQVCVTITHPNGQSVFDEDVVVAKEPPHLFTPPTVDSDAPDGEGVGSPCAPGNGAGTGTGTESVRGYARTGTNSAGEGVVCVGFRAPGAERHVRVTVH